MLAQRLRRLGHSVRSCLPSATLLSGFFRAFVPGREGGDIRRDSRMKTLVGKQRVDDLMAEQKGCPQAVGNADLQPTDNSWKSSVANIVPCAART